MMCLMYFACLCVGEIAWSSHGDHTLGIQQVHFSISKDTNKSTFMTINFHSFKHSKVQQPSLTIQAQGRNTTLPGGSLGTLSP